ncbi:hypothetical protein Tco_0690485 [Tanacetum coccineum]
MLLLASYRLFEDNFLATCEQELCPFCFLIASCQVSSSELQGSQLGKENRIYILQSIDHGPFELGTTRDTLGTTPEGGVLLGPKKPHTYDDVNDNDKKRFDAHVHATNIDRFVTAIKPNKGLKETNHEQLYAYLKQHEKHAAQDRLIIDRITPTTNDQLAFVLSVQPYTQSSQVLSLQYLPSLAPLQSPHVQSLHYPQFAETSQLDSGYTQTDEILDTLTKQFRMVGSWFRTFKGDRIRIKGTLLGEMVQQAMGDDKIELGMQMQLLFLAGEQTNTFDAYVDNQPVRDLALNEDNIFQEDECDAFNSDVDDEPTTQSIFMANLSSAGPTNLQAGPSNTSILSEITVIDSTSADMGNSNVIPYEQYLTVNDVFVVPSSASSAPNDAYVLHDNDAYVPTDPLATEINIYKEQVAIYKQRAKFELTLRERKMDEQMSILIRDRNKKEENLKKELHFVKLQLNSTIQNNKIIEETITALKQEFKQKETKFLTYFSNLKNLKDKLKNKLYSQDQSIQIVHMMLKPTKLYDQDAKTAIGVQNPFYLRKAKKAQPELYDGDELLKTHHVPITVTSSEEDLELAKTIRIKIVGN